MFNLHVNMTVKYSIKLGLIWCCGNFRVFSQQSVPMNVCSFTCMCMPVKNMYFTWDLHENKLNKTMNTVKSSS